MKNAARLKELCLKLRFGIYLMATPTISSKSTVSMQGCPLIEQYILLNQCHSGLFLSKRYLAFLYLRYFI